MDNDFKWYQGYFSPYSSAVAVALGCLSGGGATDDSKQYVPVINIGTNVVIITGN